VYFVAPDAGAVTGDVFAVVVGLAGAGGLIVGVVAGAGELGGVTAVRSGGRMRGDPGVMGADPVGGAITGASEFGDPPAVAPVAPSEVPFAPAVPVPPSGELPDPGTVPGPAVDFANALSGGVATDPEADTPAAGPIVRVCGTDAPGAIGSLMRPVADSALPESASRDAVVRDLGELKA